MAQQQTHSSKITTDHDEIRKWVESRGGHPSTVKGTQAKGEAAGLLRIDFPGFSGEGTLEQISWEEFFDKFEESRLTMVYQDQKATGQESYFCKLVSREDRERGNNFRGVACDA